MFKFVIQGRYFIYLFSLVSDYVPPMIGEDSGIGIVSHHVEVEIDFFIFFIFGMMKHDV